MKFSEKLIELRKQKGLSQEELGFKINVSRQTISKWEAEQSSPEVEKVKELSKVFDVSIEYLLNDELENPKQVSKQLSKKIIKRIFLLIALSIVAIYLVISLFKFGVLLYCSIKANKIPDFDNYRIMFGDDNIIVEEIYNKGVAITKQYSENLEIIIYENLNEGKAYQLRYEKDKDTYYYNNLLDDYNYTIQSEEAYTSEIRNLTLPEVDLTLTELILDSLNPNVKVSFSFYDGLIYIERKYGNLSSLIGISPVLGLIELESTKEKLGYEETTYITLYVYDLSETDFIIEEPDLEGIEYIVE